MRLRAIAFALPLVVGIACKTGSSSSERTASATPPAGGQPSADTQSRGAAGPTEGRDASAATAAEAQGTESGSTASGTTPPTGGQPSADTQSRGAAGPTEDRETAGATAAEADRYGSTGETGSMGSGDDVKAHASDKVVRGKITKVSSKSVTIASDDGSDRTLQIVPETTVQVDGSEAQRSDLKEGQPVRASFSEVDGREVAVEIHAGEGSSGSMMHDSGSMHESGSMGSEQGTMPESGSSETERKY